MNMLVQRPFDISFYINAMVTITEFGQWDVLIWQHCEKQVGHLFYNARTDQLRLEYSSRYLCPPPPN